MHDHRFVQLGQLTAVWAGIWFTILVSVPNGKSGRDNIMCLNAIHGLVCTIVAFATIYYKWDTSHSTAISLAYFLVDLAAMIKSDELYKKIPVLTGARKMDYVHHVIGLFWGLIFYAHENVVCTPEVGNPYILVQTNEISTPFYNWLRWTNNPIAGILFALVFFSSRVVYNTYYLIPALLSHCKISYLIGCIPYFALQYVWFAMIVKKIMRTRKSITEKDENTKKRG